MGYARIGVSPELLLDLTHGTYEVVRDGLPEGVTLRDVILERPALPAPRFADKDAPVLPSVIWLVVEHPSFVSSSEGAALPTLRPPMVRRV